MTKNDQWLQREERGRGRGGGGRMETYCWKEMNFYDIYFKSFFLLFFLPFSFFFFFFFLRPEPPAWLGRYRLPRPRFSINEPRFRRFGISEIRAVRPRGQIVSDRSSRTSRRNRSVSRLSTRGASALGLTPPPHKPHFRN